MGWVVLGGLKGFGGRKGQRQSAMDTTGSTAPVCTPASSRCRGWLAPVPSACPPAALPCAQVAAQRYQGGAMPVLYKHLVAVAYQVALFRWAGGREVQGEAPVRMVVWFMRAGICCCSLWRHNSCGAAPMHGAGPRGAATRSPATHCRRCRDALAAGSMLNRTVVLPTSWCWCDYDWTPDVLEKCKIRCGGQG